jgi:hypothetical protein
MKLTIILFGATFFANFHIFIDIPTHIYDIILNEMR